MVECVSRGMPGCVCLRWWEADSLTLTMCVCMSAFMLTGTSRCFVDDLCVSVCKFAWSFQSNRSLQRTCHLMQLHVSLSTRRERCWPVVSYALCSYLGLGSSSPFRRLWGSLAGGTTGLHRLCCGWQSLLWAAGSHWRRRSSGASWADHECCRR